MANRTKNVPDPEVGMSMRARLELEKGALRVPGLLWPLGAAVLP